MVTKGWDKTWITKAFTFDFQVEAMEANALPSFTYTLEVEKYNDVEDNETNPTNSIAMVIDNCLQPIGKCASTSSNVKVFD